MTGFIKRLIAMVSTVAATTAVADAPAPGEVQIRSVASSGNGCQPGTVAHNISDDGKALTILFDDFLVEVNPGMAPRAMESCRVNLGMHVPSGWSYGLFYVDYRGYADLDVNVKASNLTHYTFDGSARTKVGEMNLTGPVALDYEHRTQIPVNSISWSSCSTGEVKPLLIDTDIAIQLPPPVALDHRRGEDLADDIEGDANKMRSQVRRHDRSLEGAVEDLGDEADELEEQFDDEESAAQMIPRFQRVQQLANLINDRILANAALRGERRITEANAAIRSALTQIQGMLMPAPAGAGGLMTVDSFDGGITHHYGLAWKRCDPHHRGNWVQANGRTRCEKVCSDRGLALGRSPEGAQCVSGESRPLSAIGKIEFSMGCWGSCASQGPIVTNADNRSCYQPGQKKDNDRTDRIVGCFCQ